MKIFIGGPRAITNICENVAYKLLNICKMEHTILIGDASGVDSAVQRYLYQLGYKNVYVYVSNGKVRNNIGRWPVKTILVPGNMKGFNFYAEKDKSMADDADYGFMIWNGESKGTLNNIINLLTRNKEIIVYFTPQKYIYYINCFDEFIKLISLCNAETNKLYHGLLKQSTLVQSQMTLFDKQ